MCDGNGYVGNDYTQPAHATSGSCWTAVPERSSHGAGRDLDLTEALAICRGQHTIGRPRGCQSTGHGRCPPPPPSLHLSLRLLPLRSSAYPAPFVARFPGVARLRFLRSRHHPFEKPSLSPSAAVLRAGCLDAIRSRGFFPFASALDVVGDAACGPAAGIRGCTGQRRWPVGVCPWA